MNGLYKLAIYVAEHPNFRDYMCDYMWADVGAVSLYLWFCSWKLVLFYPSFIQTFFLSVCRKISWQKMIVITTEPVTKESDGGKAENILETQRQDSRQVCATDVQFTVNCKTEIYTNNIFVTSFFGYCRSWFRTKHWFSLFTDMMWLWSWFPGEKVLTTISWLSFVSE